MCRMERVLDIEGNEKGGVALDRLRSGEGGDGREVGAETESEASKLWISGGGIHTAVPPSSSSAASSSDKEKENAERNKNENENKIYNTHVIIDNHGKIKAHYHKIHLFDVTPTAHPTSAD